MKVFMWCFMIFVVFVLIGSTVVESLSMEEDFSEGKLGLFDGSCTSDSQISTFKVKQYEGQEIFEKPDNSSEYFLNVYGTKSVQSRPININEGNIIKILYSVYKMSIIYQRSLSVQILDANTNDILQTKSITTKLEAWQTFELPIEKSGVILIKLDCVTNPLVTHFVAIDRLTVNINENECLATTTTTAVPDCSTTSGVTTTEVPTTEVPTTEVPTTEVPTTEDPTTEVSTTEFPTTEVPTTEDPTTEVITTCEKCDPSTDEDSTWKIISISAICVAGVSIIGTIIISILLCQKSNSIVTAQAMPYTQQSIESIPRLGQNNKYY